MSKPNWQIKHKTKNDAYTHILTTLMENPACADTDSGLIVIQVFGKKLAMKPLKKKKSSKDDITIED